jgi:hypothetical protein
MDNTIQIAGRVELLDMAKAYLRCALFTGTDDDGDALDRDHDTDDFAEQAQRQAFATCSAFYNENKADCLAAVELYPYHADAPSGWHALGHDLWFTQNGHGVGFWDRSELDADGLGERLTKAAQALRESDVYAGDDCALYLS